MEESQEKIPSLSCRIRSLVAEQALFPLSSYQKVIENMPDHFRTIDSLYSLSRSSLSICVSPILIATDTDYTPYYQDMHKQLRLNICSDSY